MNSAKDASPAAASECLRELAALREQALALARAAGDLARKLSAAEAGSARRPWPKRVAMVVFDFDGVMTDNRVWVDARGNEQVAAFRSDGLGLGLLRRKRPDLKLLVLSAEKNRVVAARCKKLKLEVLQGQQDKAPALRRLLARRKVDPATVIFVGNDVNDLPCFALAGYGVAPSDAHAAVLAEADLVLRHPGGRGAVRELCDRLMDDGTETADEQRNGNRR